MSKEVEPHTIVDCKEAAEAVGLSYAATDAPGISRRRAGKGFAYRGPLLAHLPLPLCSHAHCGSTAGDGVARAAAGIVAREEQLARTHPVLVARGTGIARGSRPTP